MNPTEKVLYEMVAADITLRKAKKPEIKTKAKRKKEAAKEKKAANTAKEKKPKPRRIAIKEKKPKRDRADTVFKTRNKSKKIGRPSGPRKGSVLNTDKHVDKDKQVVYREDLRKLAEDIHKISQFSNIQIAHKNTLGAIGRNVKAISNFYEKKK